MTSINLHTEVFNPVYIPHLTNNSRVQIFYGGSGSGKSVFIAQRAVYDVLNDKENGGRNYLVCRAIAKDSRRSTFVEIQKVITAWKLHDLFTVNKTDLTITCNNGYQILFTGLDDLQKLKSVVPAKGAITDVWVEEATQVQREDIKELTKRQRGGREETPKRLTMSFNPIYKTHWLYLDYFGSVAWADNQNEHRDDHLSILKTWYIHNRFLTEADKADLESETDEYYYAVYTLGNWGVLGDVIFKNWRTEDLGGMSHLFVNWRGGLDFGFSSDPAALTVTHYDRAKRTIYVYGEEYARGLTNDELAELIKPTVERRLVVCDSAEPKSIAELQKFGINAVGAKKGKDSVNFGIQWLQQQTIVVDSKLLNTRTELEIYHWKKDKDGNAIRQPVDKNDHLISALRYAYEDDMEDLARGAALVAFAG